MNFYNNITIMHLRKKRRRYYMEFHKNSLKHISFLLIPSKFEEIKKLAYTRERHYMDSIHLPPFKLPNKRMKIIFFKN